MVRFDIVNPLDIHHHAQISLQEMVDEENEFSSASATSTRQTDNSTEDRVKNKVEFQYQAGYVSLPQPLNSMTGQLTIGNDYFWGQLMIDHGTVPQTQNPQRSLVRQVQRGLDKLVIEGAFGEETNKWTHTRTNHGILIMQQDVPIYAVRVAYDELGEEEEFATPAAKTCISFGTDGTRPIMIGQDEQFEEEMRRIGEIASDVANSYCKNAPEIKYQLHFKPVQDDWSVD